MAQDQLRAGYAALLASTQDQARKHTYVSIVESALNPRDGFDPRRREGYDQTVWAADRAAGVEWTEQYLVDVGGRLERYRQLYQRTVDWARREVRTGAGWQVYGSYARLSKDAVEEAVLRLQQYLSRPRPVPREVEPCTDAWLVAHLPAGLRRRRGGSCAGTTSTPRPRPRMLATGPSAATDARPW